MSAQGELNATLETPTVRACAPQPIARERSEFGHMGWPGEVRRTAEAAG